MTFDKDAVVLEKNLRIERIAQALVGLLIVVGLAKTVFVGGIPLPIFFISLPLGLKMRVSLENWRARPRNARVRAGVEGISVDGVRVLEPGQIVHALVQPRAGKKPTVRLRNKGRYIVFELEVEDEAEGAAFLRAIGHDAAARKATFTTMSPLFSTYRRAMGALVFSLGAGVGVLFTAFAAFGLGGLTALLGFLLAIVPLAVALRGREVEVGADGLSLSWNWRRRYIPFDDVAGLETPQDDGVCIVLTSGEKLHLRTGGGGIGAGDRVSMMREALRRRIVEAMEAHRARIGPRELAARLAPREDDEGAWLADLKKLRDAEGGYRAAAVREEDLWRVVEDPGAAEEARAAAALLLRNTDGARPRLRIAADAVASPRLRVALEAEEEEEAEEALRAYLRKSG